MKILKRVYNLSLDDLQELQEAILAEIARRKDGPAGGAANPHLHEVEAPAAPEAPVILPARSPSLPHLSPRRKAA